MFAIPTSGVSHVRWPAVPDATGATFLAMLRQFDESERLPVDELVALQFAALTGVLGHAGQTVPYYRDRPVYLETLGAGPLDADAWRRLPVLTRTDLQDAGTSAESEAIPPDHTPQGPGEDGFDRRSPPVEADRFAYVRLHRTAGAHCAMLGISHDIAEQARWLVAHQPTYLLSLPSNLAALVRHFLDTGTRLPSLRGVTTYGEMTGPDVRAVCRDAWGVKVSDIYSSQEVGYIALQCPEAEGLHVQAESVYVEVLDDDGGACAPGEVGRVVVSTLHNYIHAAHPVRGRGLCRGRVPLRLRSLASGARADRGSTPEHAPASDR